VSSIRRLIPVRSAILWGASIALFALLAGCVLFGLWVWSGLANLADRIAAVSVGIGAATLFITVIAALVALAAYHAATQAPDLQPQILFPGSEPNRPRLVSNPQQAQEGVFGKFADFSQLVARVRIYNASKFSARNPLMRIRLRNLSGVKESNSPYGWESLDGDANGTTWFQWEGGRRSDGARQVSEFPTQPESPRLDDPRTRTPLTDAGGAGRGFRTEDGGGPGRSH
jgi:hypothetical protein